MRLCLHVLVEEREANKQSHMQRLARYAGTKAKKKDNMKERQTERIQPDFKLYSGLAVAAPEDLSRIALASPPWPINMKLSGSREAIRLWKRKTH